MAECSQEFSGLLAEFYNEAYEDGKFQGELSGPALEKQQAILQYVAELEATQRKIKGHVHEA